MSCIGFPVTSSTRSLLKGKAYGKYEMESPHEGYSMFIILTLILLIV